VLGREQSEYPEVSPLLIEHILQERTIVMHKRRWHVGEMGVGNRNGLGGGSFAGGVLRGSSSAARLELWRRMTQS